ncbi:hypothetical protein H257_12987 [Aphanomyces astaci]|uniref:Uncharacterized protein n=1 Tax=Aphanomyces astaci TaxID=112090 RepID=W4FWH9_APHAT|nr:hypothetical protein H257_12987 [Aphanomyces astaci]ETV71852.1 hypothetical protein H257_12987 [Aphanomyces astaci]|eukprot:XP_009838701.1 hypothetical protein H257_12987 [Aphanomyces astaci]
MPPVSHLPDDVTNYVFLLRRVEEVPFKYCHVHCPPITTSRSPVTVCPLRDLRHPVHHVDLITTRVTVGPVTTTTKAPTGHQRQA